nr:MAG TPA: hypothetical protein [Caudoviricetes sp.]
MQKFLKRFRDLASKKGGYGSKNTQEIEADAVGIVN